LQANFTAGNMVTIYKRTQQTKITTKTITKFFMNNYSILYYTQNYTSVKTAVCQSPVFTITTIGYGFKAHSMLEVWGAYNKWADKRHTREETPKHSHEQFFMTLTVKPPIHEMLQLVSVQQNARNRKSTAMYFAVSGCKCKIWNLKFAQLKSFITNQITVLLHATKTQLHYLHSMLFDLTKQK
jgi:hypothetical protein